MNVGDTFEIDGVTYIVVDVAVVTNPDETVVRSVRSKPV